MGMLGLTKEQLEAKIQELEPWAINSSKGKLPVYGWQRTEVR